MANDIEPTSPKSNYWIDIRIWLFLFFLIRLVGITNPPLETGHNWRQALTAMIARNFVEQRANVLYPQIDYAGSGSGIIGSEFPFFNYLIYLVSEVAGYTHWYGRLINLVVSSLGIYFFYLLMTKLTDRKAAFSASIILLSSIWFAFSRKIMPDTFSLSLVMIGAYYGWLYFTTGKRWALWIYFLLITLGILSKIPALYLLAALGVVIFIKEIPANRKWAVVVSSSVSVALVSLWYFYWVPYLVSTYHNQLFFPRGLLEGWREIATMKADFFKNFYFNAFHSYVAFMAFIVGIYFLWTRYNARLIAGLAVVTVTFLLFVLKTGIVFPLHNYYIIPFVPVMAVVAGLAVSRLPQPYMSFILVAISLESLANQQHDFFIKEKEGYKMAVEKLVLEHTLPTDLIVINGGQSPQEIYLAHRKGWSVTNDKIKPDQMQLYRDAGARYLVVNQRTYPDSISFLPQVAANKDYAIYALAQ